MKRRSKPRTAVGPLKSLSLVPPEIELMNQLNQLIETLEQVRDAISAEDAEKGFDMITVFLMQYVAVFGPLPTSWQGRFPS